MTIIVTVHHHLVFGRAGFESSQQTRMTLARLIGFQYKHLITSPQMNGFEAKFRSIGFDYGELHALDYVFMGAHASKVDDKHYQYIRDGSIVGEAYYDDDCLVGPVPMWVYYQDNKVFTEESLVVWYLSQYPEKQDLVIFRDESRIPMPELVRFVKLFNLLYYEVIHHNVLDDGFLPGLSRKVPYLVANERLAQELADMGFNSQFLPPMCVWEKDIVSRTINPIRKYVWSAHLGGYKNFVQALRVMQQLTDTSITLDVYGGTQEAFDKQCAIVGGCPPNVTYRGVVVRVPYEQYDGFLSTSMHELFSNACIEAMSSGLKCVVSDLKYPFRDYAEKSRGEVSIAHTDEEFVSCMRDLQDNVFHVDYQIKLLKNYTYERWASRFSQMCVDRKGF